MTSRTSISDEQYDQWLRDIESEAAAKEDLEAASEGIEYIQFRFSEDIIANARNLRELKTIFRDACEHYRIDLAYGYEVFDDPRNFCKIIRGRKKKEDPHDGLPNNVRNYLNSIQNISSRFSSELY